MPRHSTRGEEALRLRAAWERAVGGKKRGGGGGGRRGIGVVADLAENATTLLIALPPWRYDAHAFSEDVRKWLRRPAWSVATLVPPCEREDGGREWWAYREEEEGGGDGAEEEGKEKGVSATHELMRALRLDAARPEEVRKAMGAVYKFVEEAAEGYDEVAIFGSSQGGSVAAHVGVGSGCAKLRRVVAHHPAGFYVDEWDAEGAKERAKVEVVVQQGVEHGDMRAWRGRMGWRPSPNSSFQGARRVLMLMGGKDVVAPASLLALIT
jgi:predicted esterase